jgi:hypothetical protein
VPSTGADRTSSPAGLLMPRCRTIVRAIFAGVLVGKATGREWWTVGHSTTLAGFDASIIRSPDRLVSWSSAAVFASPGVSAEISKIPSKKMW